MGCEQSEIADFQNMVNGLTNSNQPNATPTYTQPAPHSQPSQNTPNNYAQPSTYTKKPQQLQQQPRTSKTQGAAQPPKKARPPRQILQNYVTFTDDFLNHHLRYQRSLCKLSSKSRIRRRQILEHLLLQNYWGNVGGQSFNALSYFESLQSSWMQRTILDIWEIAHNDFFNLDVPQKIVRRKVAEQYMFELYELKEYVDAGLGNLSALNNLSVLGNISSLGNIKDRSSLVEIMQYSDDALFSIFRKLKERYPQTAQTEKIKFPDVPSTKTDMNLLNNFPSKSFSDSANYNIQTIYEDINFLLKKAIEEQDTFKQDMQDILAEDVLACPKVGQIVKDGKAEFNACAVRRVFIKWAENLLEKLPEIKKTKTFMEFIKTKSKIADNFFFKSYIQNSTHKLVIDCLCYLLEEAKFNEKKEKRKEFIFNIYDLLRCKIKRNSAEQIVALLTKMQNTKVTKNGKKFQVIRVKNRFETNNRDLLINFRYGDVLVGQAQLCIDNAHVSKVAKHNYEFCHYIYELERSLFGPTLQLMMQYQDQERPDISMNFEAEDIVKQRRNNNNVPLQKTDRKCFHGHEMVSLTGNYFMGDYNSDADSFADVGAVCNFCDRMTDTTKRYDYCFQCNCFLCSECVNDYKKFNSKTSCVSIQRQELVLFISDDNQLRNQCAKDKSLIVLFHHENISASQIMKDAMVYHQSKLSMQPNKTVPKIAIANCSDPNLKTLCNKLDIKQFPTTILFDSYSKPVRTIIGCSWLEAPFLYETQKRIINGQSIELDVLCVACKEKVEFRQMPEQQQVCLCCLNNSKPINVPEQYLTVGGFCSQNHYRCVPCSYTALDIPSFYRDQTGLSYLSSSFVSPKLRKCPKGHNITYSKTNVLQQWQIQCFGCNQKILFDDQYGVAACQPCKVGLCARCMGGFLPTLNQLKQMQELAVGYVQSTAQQAHRCFCNRPFKKVYNTRLFSLEQYVRKEQEGQKDTWKCFFCQTIHKDGEVHIACFECPKLYEATGNKYKLNFELCLPCANVSELLIKQENTKVQEAPSVFLDKKKHPMVKTSFAYDSNLTYVCAGGCNQRFYANTARTYCKLCKENYCDDCLDGLFNANPPRCNQYCRNQHPLKLQYKAKTLKFCDGCMKVIKEEYFNCAPCDYCLCTNCSNQPPGFIGTAFDRCAQGLRAQLGLEGAEEQPQYQQQQQEQAQQNNYNWGGNVYEEEEQSQENGGDWGVFGDLF